MISTANVQDGAEARTGAHPSCPGDRRMVRPGLCSPVALLSCRCVAVRQAPGRVREGRKLAPGRILRPAMLRRPALHRRDAGRPVPGHEHRRGAGREHRASPAALRGASAHPPRAGAAARHGAGLPHPVPEQPDAVGRGGAAHQLVAELAKVDTDAAPGSGGRVVAAGTPVEIAGARGSHTGEALARFLDGRGNSKPGRCPDK